MLGMCRVPGRGEAAALAVTEQKAAEGQRRPAAPRRASNGGRPLLATEKHKISPRPLTEASEPSAALHCKSAAPGTAAKACTGGILHIFLSHAAVYALYEQ
jgi:hypothetical protein